MASVDRFDEIAALMIPWPERAGSRTEYELACAQAHEARAALAERLRAEQDTTGTDPLLLELARLRDRIAEAETQRRLLLAYASRFAAGGSLLEALASASGAAMPGYSDAEVAEVAGRLGRAPSAGAGAS